MGVVLAGREQVDRVGRGVELLGARDVTVAGSRSGLAVAQLWWALHGYGPDVHRLRAGRARAATLPAPALRRVLRRAAAVSTVWACGAVLMVPLSVADLLGRELPDVITARHLLDIAPKVPFVAAWYVAGVLAAAGWRAAA